MYSKLSIVKDRYKNINNQVRLGRAKIVDSEAVFQATETNPASIYLPTTSATNRMWHKFNFLSDFKRLEFRLRNPVFFIYL